MEDWLLINILAFLVGALLAALLICAGVLG
jgi:hypothetical protein